MRYPSKGTKAVIHLKQPELKVSDVFTRILESQHEAVSSLSEEKHLKLFGWGLLRGKRGKGVRKQGDVCVEN